MPTLNSRATFNAEITRDSPKTSEKVIIYLQNRLKGKTSAYVKWKVLNIIKHVVGKGSHNFKMGCQKTLAPDCKVLLHFKGKSDPIKGDQPNKQVRASAKAALAAIFSSKKSSSNRQNVGRSTRMMGISSDSFNKPPAVSDESRRSRNDGGGENIFGDAPKGWSFKSNRGNNNVHTNRPDYDAPGQRSNIPPRDPRSPKSSSRRKGGVGGNWGNAKVELKTLSSSSVGGGLRRKTNNKSSPRRDSVKSRLASLEVGKAITDGTFERQLVDNLVGTGGIRADIPKSKISEFCLRCRTLRADVVVPILFDRLDSKKWQRRARSVFVIDALVKDRGCTSYKTFIRDMDSSWLADRFESESNKRVRTVMHDALLSLYPDEYEEESDEENGGGVEDDDDDDLLGLMGESSGGNQKKEKTSDDMSDLFGGMSMSGNVKDDENGGGFSFIDAGEDDDDDDQEESLSSGFDFVGSGGSGGGDNNEMDDMFSGMNVKSSTTTRDDDDIFGSSTQSNTTTTTTTTTSLPGMSIFDQLSTTNTNSSFLPPPPRNLMSIPSPATTPTTATTVTVSPPVVSTTSSTGSTGFGFMNKKEDKKDAFDFVGDLLH